MSTGSEHRTDIGNVPFPLGVHHPSQYTIVPLSWFLEETKKVTSKSKNIYFTEIYDSKVCVTLFYTTQCLHRKWAEWVQNKQDNILGYNMSTSEDVNTSTFFSMTTPKAV